MLRDDFGTSPGGSAEQRAALTRLLSAEAELDEQIRDLEALSATVPDAELLAEVALRLRRRCRRLAGVPADAMDLCGTGGDHSGTFNISTAAALVAAGAGITVAKHGNRSVSSRCGSADCLQALGVDPQLEPETCAVLLQELGIAFLFAPRFHPLMARLMPARRALARRGRKTIFNVVGPLINPAFVRRQAVGVFAENLILPVAGALTRLGVRRGIVYHGDGLDEVTLTGPTRVGHIEDGRVRRGRLEPRDFGLRPCRMEDLAGGDASENARIVLDILEGRIRDARRDMVVANAAVGIVVGAPDAPPLSDAVARAERSIDSGRAREILAGSACASRDSETPAGPSLGTA